MLPTEILVREHTLIERYLDLLERAIRTIEDGRAVPPEALGRIVEFIGEFADRRHHRKEEDLLFPALERAGLPRDGGPVGVMLAEHDEGRAHVSEMAAALERLAAGEAEALEAFAMAGRAFAMLLRSHIQKENGVLFRLAERVLDEATQQELTGAFTEADAERDPEAHERYAALIEKLSESV